MKKPLLSIFLFALTAFAAKAQDIEYALSAFTAPYVELTGATVYNQEIWLYPEIEIELEFPFLLGNETLTTLIQDGGGAEWGIFEENGYSAVGWINDFISSSNADDPGAPSTISWLTEGSAGNRILKIQYKDVAFYEEWEFLGTVENRVNFQIWFYEEGSAIEFRFGSSNIVDPSLAYFDYDGPILYMVANYQDEPEDLDYAWFIIGDPADPELFTITDISLINDDEIEELEITLTGTPDDGQVYRLDRLVVSTRDKEQARFKLYPTIAEQEVRLSGELAATQNYRIVNVSGATVQNGVLNNGRVDVSGLAPGVYLMQIDGHMTAQKFVKR